jgi:predicted amidohydrolase YtcJ
MGFFAAQRRRAHDVDFAEQLGASRALTGEEMLAGYTRNPALAIGAISHRGSLEPGKAADLVVWADDPAACSPEDVLDLPILRTVVAGRTVFSAA